MKSKERCLAMLRGDPVDRVPVFPLLMFFSADRAGISYRSYATSGHALAYWQLLLMRDGVDNVRPAWYSSKADPAPQKRSPGVVQRGALRFLVALGTQAHATRTAGKGKGRTKGFHPTPRTRFPVVKKAKSTSDRTSQSP